MIALKTRTFARRGGVTLQTKPYLYTVVKLCFLCFLLSNLAICKCDFKTK